MSRLDPSVLDSLIADYLGPHAQWSRMGSEKLTPMSVAIDEATRDLQREVAVYWVDGGLPENFSLPGFEPAPIVFSTRFIEIQATLFRLLRNAATYSDELLSAVAESISLQIAAALILDGGDPATACYLMMRSEIVCQNIYFLPSTISALELQDKNESYMAVWFYALLHEIGHVFAVEHARDVNIVSSPDLAEEIRRALDEMSFPADLVDQLRSRLEAQGLLHSLHPDQIMTEIYADVFAVYALSRATAIVMEKDGRGAEFSLGRLAICIYEIFNVLILLNNCAMTARQVSSLADLRDEPWVNVSYRVRTHYVLMFLARLLADDGEADSVGEWSSRIADATAQYAHSLTTIESGQARAMRQVLFPAERDEDLGSHFDALVQDPSSGLSEFIAAADALNITHPDVEYLRQHLEGTSQEGRGYLFTTLWVTTSDGNSVPFALPTRYGSLIFVFSQLDEVYASFRDETASIITWEAQLEEVAILANHTWQAEIVCIQATPVVARPQTHVVVEGSALFDRMLRELAEGSIWPDAGPLVRTHN